MVGEPPEEKEEVVEAAEVGMGGLAEEDVTRVERSVERFSRRTRWREVPKMCSARRMRTCQTSA